MKITMSVAIMIRVTDDQLSNTILKKMPEILILAVKR